MNHNTNYPPSQDFDNEDAQGTRQSSSASCPPEMSAPQENYILGQSVPLRPITQVPSFPRGSSGPSYKSPSPNLRSTETDNSRYWPFPERHFDPECSSHQQVGPTALNTDPLGTAQLWQQHPQFIAQISQAFPRATSSGHLVPRSGQGYDSLDPQQLFPTFPSEYSHTPTHMGQSSSGGPHFGTADRPETTETERLALIEEKRHRSLAASARFRIKRKHKTLNLERSVSGLLGRAEELQKEVTELREENGWLKEIVILAGSSKARNPEDGDDQGDSSESGEEQAAVGEFKRKSK